MSASSSRSSSFRGPWSTTTFRLLNSFHFFTSSGQTAWHTRRGAKTRARLNNPFSLSTESAPSVMEVLPRPGSRNRPAQARETRNFKARNWYAWGFQEIAAVGVTRGSFVFRILRPFVVVFASRASSAATSKPVESLVDLRGTDQPPNKFLCIVTAATARGNTIASSTSFFPFTAQSAHWTL